MSTTRVGLAAMTATFLLGLSWLAAGTSPPPPADLYVATTGNDSNPGTEALPFASIARAQEAAAHDRPSTDSSLARIGRLPTRR